MPRWDAHFGDLEDDRKDSTGPRITFILPLEATDSVVWRYVHFTLALVWEVESLVEVGVKVTIEQSCIWDFEMISKSQGEA